MFERKAMLSVMGAVLALSGCNWRFGHPQNAEGTSLAEGNYGGDGTCLLTYEDPELRETFTETVSGAIEISDDGVWLLDGEGVHVGQVSTRQVGGMPSVQLTLTNVSMTSDSIVVEADVLYPERYPDGTVFNYEGTGTFVIRAGGSNRITESMSLVVTHHRDEFWDMSLSQECESVMTK